MIKSAFELVLASASPRRRELIRLLGLPYRCVASQYVEPSPPDREISLPEFVSELAANKALEVAGRLNVGWVIGADTMVCADEARGIPLGKPTDGDDALRMLRALSGRDHFVYSGVALIPPWPSGESPTVLGSVTRTRVWFRRLSDRLIDDYVATGEPMDKAGAYGAQGFAAPFIERIDGDYYNVVGLPLCDIGRLLEQSGLDWQSMRMLSGDSAASGA